MSDDAGERLDGPRISFVAPDDMNEEQRSLMTDKQSELSLFQLLARHPEVLRRLKAVGSFANRDSQLPAKDRELMILRMAWHYNSEFEWGQHYQQAIEAGWSAEDCERLKDRSAVEGWDDWAMALLSATDGLLDQAMIPTPAWNMLRTRYSEEMMLELVIFFGHYTMVTMFANSFGLGLSPGRPGFSTHDEPTGV